jgi:hypothetical protein
MYRFLLLTGLTMCIACESQETPATIDRQAVVSRHNVQLDAADTLNSLSLGNGRFAMTMDVTGLQTFSEAYQHGVPLGTQSEWGWHRFPSEENYRIEETLKPLASHGRMIPYARQWPSGTRAWAAGNSLRQNPHRIHLANVGWHILTQAGAPIALTDVTHIEQTLKPYQGELVSTFEIEGEAVAVTSLVSQTEDRLGVQVASSLLATGRLALRIDYPYPTDQWLDEAAHYDQEEPSRLTLTQPDAHTLSIRRALDHTVYVTHVSSSQPIDSLVATSKGFIVRPEATDGPWQFSVVFSQEASAPPSLPFAQFQEQVHRDMRAFWQAGGMIDFGAVADPQAAELERRMVLSQYLTHVNCGGQTPPQETGLTFNSWFGKPHMEMAWWHGVHFALWDRPEVLEQHLDWYLRNDSIARVIAARQGFAGVRWQKMTDPWGGETASSVGSYLLWQQPHPIYFAELIYRARQDEATLRTYQQVIEETADFMADFAWYDSTLGRYILGPGVIAAQERFDPTTTFNPTFELAYWRWGLEAAQRWRERLGLPRQEKWDRVLAELSPLPQQDGLYLATESAPDSYTTDAFMTDHPSVLGTLGMLPATQGLDTAVMRRTFDKIWNDWQWHDTWGWDFPMAAMTATRLGLPELAVEALLMDIQTNTYLKNGHNYQDDRLRLYLPGNGGLLIALAMMAAGTDGHKEDQPGFPKDWKIRYENLVPMP